MEINTVHEQISQIAVTNLDKIAIEQGERRVSYRELEMKSNQIANFLYGKLADNKNVPVMLDNSIELVEAILGSLKAGAIFAPIDPEFPENRIQLMVDKIDADWVITRARWLRKLDKMLEGSQRRINALVVDLNTLTDTKLTNIDIFLLDQTQTSELSLPADKINKHCYIYFTSGSLGKPKAILGRHRSLKHFIDWEIKEFGVDGNFRVSQLTSPSFDPFLRDVFVPLCAGATLCIPENREMVLNPKKLKAWIDQSKVTLVHIVPTLFRAMASELEDAHCFNELRYIILAGELLRGNDLKKFTQLFGTRIQLVNMYGPTETTLAKLFYRVQESDVNRVSVPVGKPIPGAQVMILTSDLQACPKGNIGEVYIRTPFISSGYYGDSDLTRAVFIKNPFSENPQDVIYKTGDLGKLLPNGDLELMGRTDHQVKLRGFRVELGEIENQLLAHDDVIEAVVVARDDEVGGKYLCAYIVGDKELSVAELREKLAKELPNYMIPAYFVQLERLPLTPNGKVDRKVLPQPQASLDMSKEYVEPVSEAERKLVSIWEEVLGIKGIGSKHNFFDIGGNSINSLKVIDLIKKEFNVDISLGELMVNPTIAAIAKNIYTESILGKLDCVVKLNQTAPEKRNIFIIHSIDGMVFHYKKLAQLLEPLCNFYGIQARGILKEAILPTSVDELVKEYMYEMKAIQPEGPYIIGGHCFGMMFAYEMARMLEERGEKVEKVIIIDEQMFLNKNQLSYMKFNTYLYKPYRMVKKLYYQHFTSPLNAEDYLAKKPRPTGGELQSGEVVSKNFQYLGRNRYKYKGFIKSPIFAIKAQDSVWQRFTKEHWSKMTSGNVEIVEIPGDHWNLFNAPYVEELARVMKIAVNC